MPKYGPRSQADFRARHSSRFSGQEGGPFSVRNPRSRGAFFHSSGFCCHPLALTSCAASRPLLAHRTCQPRPMPIATTTLPLARQPSPPRRPQRFFHFPFPPISSRKSSLFLPHIHHRKRKPHNRRHFRIRPLVSSFTPPLRRCSSACTVGRATASSDREGSRCSVRLEHPGSGWTDADLPPRAFASVRLLLGHPLAILHALPSAPHPSIPRVAGVFAMRLRDVKLVGQ